MGKQDLSGISKNLAASIKDDRAHKEVISLPLSKLRIGISISESEDSQALGFSIQHQKDFTIEITRYLLANGAHLVYGGDLRKDGFTYAFSELAFQYRRKETSGDVHFTNYFGWPIHLNLTRSDEVEFKKNRVEVFKCSPPSEVPINRRDGFISPDSDEHKMFWARSMTMMREKMVSDCNGRVVLGGQITGYKGFYPGIIEETYYALKQRQPVFLLGAIGGATGFLIRAIKGEAAKSLVDELTAAFPQVTKLKAPMALVTMLNEIRAIGLAGLAKFNRLTIQQNHILFESRQFQEMIFYILTGLHTISFRKKK